MKSVLFTAAALASVAYAGVVAPAVDAKSTVTLTATTSVGCSKSVPTTHPGSKCNVTGTLSKPSLIKSSKGTLQACQDACFFYTDDESDCKTFGYDSNTKECQLFDSTLPEMGYTKGDSDFVYSNQNCIACAQNPPASSSATGTPIMNSSSESSSSSSKTKKTKTKSSSTDSADAISSSSSSTSMPKPTSTTKTKTKTKSSSSSTDVSSSSSSSSAAKTTKTKTKSSSASATDSASSSSTATVSSSSTSSAKASKTSSVAHDRCASTSVNAAATATATGGIYQRYYVGSGYTENVNNPGNLNSQQPPINSTLVGPFSSDCDAISACAKQAFYASYQYYSFDLHLMESTGDWICTQYYDPNSNETYFNQKNDDVVVAYGFYNTDY